MHNHLFLRYLICCTLLKIWIQWLISFDHEFLWPMMSISLEFAAFANGLGISMCITLKTGVLRPLNTIAISQDLSYSAIILNSRTDNSWSWNFLTDHEYCIGTCCICQWSSNSNVYRAYIRIFQTFHYKCGLSR